MRARVSDTSRRAASERRAYELEVIPGLEAIAAGETQRALRSAVAIAPSYREGLIPIATATDPARLLELRTVLAVYRRHTFDVPRPKALLGQSVFDTLLASIAEIRSLHGRGAFDTFRVSAAGADSSVMQRFRTEIAAATGLDDVEDEGDLLLRVRRAPDRDGWDVLIRLSPRPLSARAWRVCNLAGAINASVAHAMALLSQPAADDAVLNVACGSGTLLIERLLAASARIAIGCDPDGFARRCAEENVAASGLQHIRIEGWDAGALPTPDAWADALLADLPFGQLVGSADENEVLYPRIAREAARVTIDGGLFVAITQDIRRWERAVADAGAWQTDAVLPIKLPFSGGHLRPRIFVLRRNDR